MKKSSIEYKRVELRSRESPTTLKFSALLNLMNKSKCQSAGIAQKLAVLLIQLTSRLYLVRSAVV